MKMSVTSRVEYRPEMNLRAGRVFDDPMSVMKWLASIRRAVGEVAKELEAAAGTDSIGVRVELEQDNRAALVIGERYTAYGVVGSMIMVLLWVYMASNILFVGAEYIQVIRHDAPKRSA